MSSPASTRRRGRPAQNSATASPAQSTRSRQTQPGASSPVQMDTDEQTQVTPRATRRLRGEDAVPSSSPILFNSSPLRTARSSAQIPDIRLNPSSPLLASSTRDGDATPRGNRDGIRGMSDNMTLRSIPPCLTPYPRFVTHSLRFELESDSRSFPSGASIRYSQQQQWVICVAGRRRQTSSRELVSS